MASIFDYLSWRGDLSFAQSPFNNIDNIILCQLSYLPFDGIMPGPDDKNDMSVKDAMAALAGQKPPMMFKEDPRLVSALAASPRFSGCRLCAYVNYIDIAREVQFSALCVNTGGSWFVVYRGTDDSIVGWKEDFNMSFCEAIPAQLEAADYLAKMAGRIKGRLQIGGHSKGGNLAVYAASQSGKSIQKRIASIYCNDAPGFHKSIIESAGFAAIRERIHAFIPQSSVVGMLLEHGAPYSVIKSSQTGLLQHELYSWEVTHNDMVYADEVTLGSRFVDKTLREWISTLDNARREQFFDALYAILRSSKATSLPELEKSWPGAVGHMLQSLNGIDESTRHLIRATLAALLQSARKNINTLFEK